MPKYKVKQEWCCISERLLSSSFSSSLTRCIDQASLIQDERMLPKSPRNISAKVRSFIARSWIVLQGKRFGEEEWVGPFRIGVGELIEFHPSKWNRHKITGSFIL